MSSNEKFSKDHGEGEDRVSPSAGLELATAPCPIRNWSARSATSA